MTLPELTDLPDSLTLRACKEEDRAFLQELYLETSGGTFLQLRLPPEQLRGLLEMQFQAREEGWRARYPQGRFQIVCFKGEAAGYFALGDWEDQISLIYLGLLESFQGRGIGATLTRALQAAASQGCHRVIAHVQVGNPALGFWQHMNFTVTNGPGVHLKLEWNP